MGPWHPPTPFTDGTTRIADRNYIMQSILNPQSQVVVGFSNVNMPVYAARSSRVVAITAYIRSLAIEEP